jgi:CubicO group peptidase (beta-lactamase class C family)
MILYEEGKFQLNEPVEEYLPKFNDRQVLIGSKLVETTHAFTIRELMSHTADLTYGIFGNTSVDQKYRAALWEESLSFKKISKT